MFSESNIKGPVKGLCVRFTRCWKSKNVYYSEEDHLRFDNFVCLISAAMRRPFTVPRETIYRSVAAHPFEKYCQKYLTSTDSNARGI